jgi:signal transduction histidine kinase
MSQRLIITGIAVIAVVLATAWYISNQSVTNNLDDLPAHLPYRAFQDERFFVDHTDPTPGNAALGDVDGDGIVELVKCSSRGLICMKPGEPTYARRIPWQKHLGSKLGKPEARMRLSFCGDINDDGADEVVLTYRETDSKPWHLHIYDSRTGDATRDFVLQSYVDRDSNDIWDGNYYPIGLLESATTTGQPGIVLICNVGYDAYRRAVILVDPDTGEYIWEHEVSHNPYATEHWIGDLDGDGDTEIVVAGGSPGNMADRILDGYNDSVSQVTVISHTGELEWAAPFGAHFFDSYVVIGDLNNDDELEVVVATRHHSADHGDTLAVLSGRTGTRLAWVAAAENFTGLALGPEDELGQRRIYTGSRSGILKRFVYQNDCIELEKSIPASGTLDLVSISDLIPEHDGDEILVGRRDSTYITVDLDFNPLASIKTIFNTDDSSQRVLNWAVDGFEQITLSVTNSQRQGFWYEKRPPDFPFAAIIVAALVVLAALVGRHFRYQLQALIPQKAERKMKLMLLNRSLEEIDHGKFKPMDELESAIHRLKHLSENEAERNLWVTNFRKAFYTFRDDYYNDLLGALGIAKVTNFQLKMARKIEKDLRALFHTLEALDESDLPQSQVEQVWEPAIKTCRTIQEDLKLIKYELKNEFRVNSTGVIQQALAKNQKLIDTFQIETDFCISDSRVVATLSPEELKDFDCLIDKHDLLFIVENLIGNACLAMESSPVRKLTIAVERLEMSVVITFTDTGKGIAPNRVKTIFTGLDSERGGGLGLKGSRDKLPFWHGSLELDFSRPGEGSRFKLMLRASKFIQ